MKKVFLVVEKYTAYDYTIKNGNISKISSSRLDELKLSHNSHNNIKLKLIKFLEKNNFEYLLVKDDSLKDLTYSKFTHIISLGGDGTAIHASAYIKKQLFIPINTDINKSIGFLSKISEHNLDDALEQLVSSRYKIHKWNRLYVKINNKRCSSLALNEVLIANPNINKTSHILVEIGNKSLSSISNGIIIATNKGSHAFFKSSGGTPFEMNGIAYILLLPYKVSGDLLNSHILKEDTIIKVMPKREHIVLMFDSQESRSYPLNQGDVIEIGVDKNNPLNVIHTYSHPQKSFQ